MEQSILNSTKKSLGLASEYDAFDSDVIDLINSVFSVLHQLGVGPEDGFMIEDASATWDSYIPGNMPLNVVRSYVFLRVRIVFDPPTTSFVLEALKEQIKEMEWRINVYREGEKWVPSILTTTPSSS